MGRGPKKVKVNKKRGPAAPLPLADMEVDHLVDENTPFDPHEEDEMARAETMAEALDSRPKATNKAYEKAEEFIDYCCKERRYPDGAIVSGKLILWLVSLSQETYTASLKIK